MITNVLLVVLVILLIAATFLMYLGWQLLVSMNLRLTTLSEDHTNLHNYVVDLENDLMEGEVTEVEEFYVN